MSSDSTDHPAPVPRRAARSERAWAFAVALASLGVLATAAWLEPASEGHGTHERLGLEPCVWVTAMDTPCPTCGMTTAFAHAADADFSASLATQPFGMILSVIAATVFWMSLHVWITASTVGRVWLDLLGAKVLWGTIGALLLAWAYKLATWAGA